MRKLGWAALGVGMALAMAAPADAEVMIATVNGTVGTVFQSGVNFGAASLAGDPFTAVFRFNSDVSGAVTTPTSIDAVGGFCCLTEAPVYDATLTVNGVSHDVGGQFNSEIRYDTATGTVRFVAGRNDAVDLTLTIWMSGANIPLSFDTPFSLTQDAGSVFRYQQVFETTDRAQLIATSLTVVRAVVPEPTTWAMMILGFFGLGATLRQRRQGLAA